MTAVRAHSSETLSNSAIAAAYLSHQRESKIAPASLNAAKMALTDWVAVSLGARGTPEALILKRYLADTPQAPGKSPLLIGGQAAATTAALINGTLSHCLDYDDTHIPTALHGSGPTWAAVFALGVEKGASEEDLLKAFVCGFEIGASIGGDGIGVRLNESGWHSTAVLGRISAATAASYLLRLEPDVIESALGLAATQAGGLTASFGTMAKPFHAGKAAMDGIVAAQFASAGLQASKTLLDSPKGLFGTIFQDRSVVPSLAMLNTTSQLLLNSLKPYSACQLTHAPIDAARQLREQIGAAPIESIKLWVNPLAIEIAGIRDARTATQGRFSTGYCVALAMHGYPVSPSDFVPERLADAKLIDLAARVTMEGTTEIPRTAVRLEARLADGRTVKTDVEHAFGSAGNPMDWAQLELKFQSLVEPAYGNQTAGLYELLANFERPGALNKLVALANKLAPI
jgi:2-methylcitrate dehydratase PrpD